MIDSNDVELRGLHAKFFGDIRKQSNKMSNEVDSKDPDKGGTTIEFKDLDLSKGEGTAALGGSSYDAGKTSNPNPIFNDNGTYLLKQNDKITVKFTVAGDASPASSLKLGQLANVASYISVYDVADNIDICLVPDSPKPNSLYNLGAAVQIETNSPTQNVNTFTYTGTKNIKINRIEFALMAKEEKGETHNGPISFTATLHSLVLTDVATQVVGAKEDIHSQPETNSVGTRDGEGKYYIPGYGLVFLVPSPGTGGVFMWQFDTSIWLWTSPDIGNWAYHYE